MINLALLGAIAGSGSTAFEAYTALAQTVLSSSTSSVTFTSAGSSHSWTNFNELLVLASTRSSTSGNKEMRWRMNSDSTSSYEVGQAYSQGSSFLGFSPGTLGYGAAFDTVPGSDATANVYGSFKMRLCQINDTSFDSGWDGFSSTVPSTQGVTSWNAGAWTGSSAVTSLQLFPPTGSFVSGSRFTLYGIVSVAS